MWCGGLEGGGDGDGLRCGGGDGDELVGLGLLGVLCGGGG